SPGRSPARSRRRASGSSTLAINSARNAGRPTAPMERIIPTIVATAKKMARNRQLTPPNRSYHSGGRQFSTTKKLRHRCHPRRVMRIWSATQHRRRMLKRFLLGWLAIAIAVGLTACLLPGMDVDGGFGSLLIIAAVFGLVNAILGSILRVLTIPLTVMTLGLFSLVVNAILLLVTAWLL